MLAGYNHWHCCRLAPCGGGGGGPASWATEPVINELEDALGCYRGRLLLNGL